MKISFGKNAIYKTFIVMIAIIVSFAYGCKKDNTVTNSTPAAGSANQVAMQNSTFSPASLTVTAGTTVTWTNKDSYDHTVTSGAPGTPDGKFDSGTIGANKTFSFKFDSKGTYSYYCKIHAPSMVGTIVVQ